MPYLSVKEQLVTKALHVADIPTTILYCNLTGKVYMIVNIPITTILTLICIYLYIYMKM